jgi:hypothetical protein
MWQEGNLALHLVVVVVAGSEQLHFQPGPLLQHLFSHVWLLCQLQQQRCTKTWREPARSMALFKLRHVTKHNALPVRE